MKNNTLVGYITDTLDVIVDQFDIDHDCVGYDCKNHAYIIGSVLNVQGQPASKILQAFKAGIKDMDHFRPVSDVEIIMTGRHLLDSKGYIYDKAPISVHDIIYAEVSDDYGCVRITLHYQDESKAVYAYGLKYIDDIVDVKLLKDAGIDLRIL